MLCQFRHLRLQVDGASTGTPTDFEVTFIDQTCIQVHEDEYVSREYRLISPDGTRE